MTSKNKSHTKDDDRVVYHVLLTMMLTMFLVHPYLSESSIVSKVFYMTILVGAAVGAIRSRERWVGVSIITLVLAGVFWEGGSIALALVAYLLAIGVFVRRVFSHGIVTSATVSGALCAYLMIGIAWMLAYMLLHQVQPESFRGLNSNSDAFYYSFVTLTTLGFGDIAPVTSMAKNLSCLEALIGQIYLVAVVARLVGFLRVPDPPPKS